MKALLILLAVCFMSGCATVSQQTIAERRWERSLEAYDSPYNDLETLEGVFVNNLKAKAVLDEREGKK